MCNFFARILIKKYMEVLDMDYSIENILVDFITVYLHDRKADKTNDECIKQELKRLYIECDVNSSMLVDDENEG